MASGGYRPPGNTTDFLEEWKAKREKMRARFAAATGANSAEIGPNRNGAPPAPPPAELSNNNNGGGERERAATRTAAPLNKRPADEDGTGATKGSESAARNPLPDEVDAENPPVTTAAAAASSSSPPASSKSKEKGKSSGPSARKGKAQIEKRKLREKRRSTGVVNIPSTEVGSSVL
ncbi:PRKC apoptosis WT1 regulator protein [Rhincodon typus]|uniref:PRKC apoptosis WT1 regulator protein n=1 Tax=Rhincodon typus TaxID=259920 RepID=UPI00202E42A0|nr:PRKC apoptosis WT1 regulator protein [Rhincodon typus]